MRAEAASADGLRAASGSSSDDAAPNGDVDAAKSLRPVLAQTLQWWDGHPRQRPGNGDRTIAGEGGTVPAKYVVTKSRGKFSYELKASNGQTIVKMGPYNDKRAVNNAIKALQKNSAASVEDTTESDGAASKTAKAARSTRSTASRTTKSAKKTARGAKRATTKKATPKRATSKKATTRKSTAKSAAKASPSKTTARKTTTRKTAARKTTPRKTTTRKTTPRKTARRTTAATRTKAAEPATVPTSGGSMS